MVMTENKIKEAIKTEEGLRSAVYKDTTGVLTVGYGHALHLGSTIPREAAEIIFDADYEIAVEGYNRLDLQLDSVRRSAVVDMVFNMGVSGVRSFEHMLFALRHGDWIRAANELMDSEYARQVPARARRNRDKIIYGEAYRGHVGS